MSDFSEGHDLGKLQGKREEQQRIIKLLQDAQVTEVELFDGRTIKVKCESVRADLLIALIKGEGENMKAIRADRNSDIAQQEYADFSNPLIKGEK